MAEFPSLDPCRLCLEYFAHTIDICDLSNKRSYLINMVHRLFSLEINSTDDFSSVVCDRCVTRIEDIYKYYVQVTKAQAKLSQMRITDERLNNAKKYFMIGDDPLQQTCDVHNNKQTKSIYESKVIDFKTNMMKEHVLSKEDDNNVKILDQEVKLELEDNVNDYEEDILDFEVPLAKKNILRKRHINKCKPTLGVSVSPCSSNRIVDDSTATELPSEIYKDGKLFLKGTALENAVRTFYNMCCQVCKTSPKFSTLTELYSHFETVHQMKGYLICCNKRLYHRRTIYTHMARHLQPNAFECPICKKSVSLPDNLIVHLQTHLPESEKPHKCDQCERRYSCIAGLSAHKLTHVPLEKRGKFECEICGKVFSLSTSFAGHMNVVHSKTKFLCAECGRSFKSKASLTSHMMTHDTEGKYEMKCLKCGFMCKNKRSLKLHTRRHDARRLFCTKCEYNTHLRARLNVHIKVKHSDTKPFDCTQCDRKFKLYQGLRTHMAQHTGERRYSCKFCPKTFVSSGNYYTHRKRMHSGLYSKKEIPELNDETISNAPIEPTAPETVNLAREQIKIFEANHKKIAKKTSKSLKTK